MEHITSVSDIPLPGEDIEMKTETVENLNMETSEIPVPEQNTEEIVQSMENTNLDQAEPEQTCSSNETDQITEVTTENIVASDEIVQEMVEPENEIQVILEQATDLNTIESVAETVTLEVQSTEVSLTDNIDGSQIVLDASEENELKLEPDSSIDLDSSDLQEQVVEECVSTETIDVPLEQVEQTVDIIVEEVCNDINIEPVQVSETVVTSSEATIDSPVVMYEHAETEAQEEAKPVEEEAPVVELDQQVTEIEEKVAETPKEETINDSSENTEVFSIEEMDNSQDKLNEDIELKSDEPSGSNKDEPNNDPIITFEPEKQKPKTSTTNSTVEAIKSDWDDDVLTIEELKEDMNQSTTSASPQPEPIIDENSSPAQEVKQACELVQDEPQQITEVLVIESVDQEVAMEVDGQLTTASVTENVTIEIIDDMKIDVNDQKHNIDAVSIEVVQESSSDKSKDDKKTGIKKVSIENIMNAKNLEKMEKEKASKSTEVKVEDKPDAAEVKVKEESLESKGLNTRSRDRMTRARAAASIREDNVKVPCHVLGRSVENPTEDLVSNGRAPPKPRLGVKVPYRFLTSQIVSKQEFADELLERVSKRNPEPDPPAGGDIFFAKKLTQRLANTIAMSEEKRNKKKTLAALSGAVAAKLKAAASKPVENPEEASSGSSGIPDEAMKTPTNTDAPASTDAPTSSKNEISDNSDLLDILEGNVEVDWTKEVRNEKSGDPKTSKDPEANEPDVSPPVLTPENVASVNKDEKNTPPKLDTPTKSTKAQKKIEEDPEKVRLIALKQLKELPRKEPGRRGRRSMFASQPINKPVAASEDVKKETVVDPVLPTTSTKEPVVEPVVEAAETTENVAEKICKVIKKSLDEKLDAAAKEEQASKTIQDEASTEKPDEPEVELTEPSLTPRRVTKTYSRKEAVLDVPEDLEFIVNETDQSALVGAETIEDNAVKTEQVDEVKEEDKSASDKEETEKEKPVKKQQVSNKKNAANPEKSQPAKRGRPSLSDMNKPEVTLVSKRARIIKKKVIWDPAEVPKPRALTTKKSTPAYTKAAKKTEKSTKKTADSKEDKKKVDESETNNEESSPEKEEESVPNGRARLRAAKVVHIQKTKMLRRAVLSQKAKKLLMKRQLRSNFARISKSSNGELKSSLALSKKKKQALADIAKTLKPKKTELDRLLMDEGAVNMLYSVRREERTPNMSGSKRSSVSSLGKAPKDLKSRAKAVKDVITQSSNQEDSPKTLRKKESPSLTLIGIASPPRKKSRDSIRSSLQSPPPSPSFLYHHRAEASRIIRRHSSSFSSECSSPRRLSIDTQNQPQQTPSQDPLAIKSEVQDPEKPKESSKQKEPAEPQVSVRMLRRKGVPIFERKLEEKTYKGKKKLLPETEQKETDAKDSNKDAGERLAQKSDKEKLTVAEKRKLNTEMTKNFSKQPSPKKRTRNSKANEEDETKDGDDKGATKVVAKNTPKVVKKNEKTPEVAEDKQRMSTRQVSVSTNYKEISLRKIDSLVQIILTPTSTKLKNPINLQMFQELCDVLSQLSNDETCRVVIMTSTDSSFCHGVDFSALIQSTAEKRLAAAQEMAKALKEFLCSLARFPKPLVAGVQGSAAGLGVTMLPLFDLVFASDKATFSTPYGRLGHVPEGIAFLTLPHLLGNTLTSELLFANRKLTASEALHHGLVTRILWPDKFQEELISNALTVANQSSQCMLATKSLLRQSLLVRLDEALDSENKLLVEHWTSTECQQNFKKLLQEDAWW